MTTSTRTIDIKPAASQLHDASPTFSYLVCVSQRTELVAQHYTFFLAQLQKQEDPMGAFILSKLCQSIFL